ncbi:MULTISPECIES: hypothetical protein [unclassified Anaeromyxobacter]|uniref:hypothetical protein n=1 Tax=unclassified Anaeromyxobacter TaxID=2620896 RepID=UPI001F571C40|nr:MULTISPECIES: hypothetical protein [unclassified Anaeromyxobacter]
MSSNRLLALLTAVALSAPAAALAEGDLPIQDNSFLIEEAYNQEPGVIQHISTFSRVGGTGAWLYSFTEEWPVLGQTHQASVTLNYAGLEAPRATGLGDLMLNYRWQAIGSGETEVALAPRLSVLVPTGDERRGLGLGGAGVQVNLPLSAMLGRRFVTHVNLGGTYVPSALASDGGHGALTSFSAGQSLIWLAHARFNVLTEVLYTRSETARPGANDHAETFTVNPGVRGAIDFASGLQIVPGVSVPLGVGPSHGERAVFLYLSFEHPFRLAGPTAEASAKPSADGRG